MGVKHGLWSWGTFNSIGMGCAVRVATLHNVIAMLKHVISWRIQSLYFEYQVSLKRTEVPRLPLRLSFCISFCMYYFSHSILFSSFSFFVSVSFFLFIFLPSSVSFFSLFSSHSYFFPSRSTCLMWSTLNLYRLLEGHLTLNRIAHKFRLAWRTRSFGWRDALEVSVGVIH
jgi:hypothetical protein